MYMSMHVYLEQSVDQLVSLTVNTVEALDRELSSLWTTSGDKTN